MKKVIYFCLTVLSLFFVLSGCAKEKYTLDFNNENFLYDENTIYGSIVTYNIEIKDATSSENAQENLIVIPKVRFLRYEYWKRLRPGEVTGSGESVTEDFMNYHYGKIDRIIWIDDSGKQNHNISINRSEEQEKDWTINISGSLPKKLTITVVYLYDSTLSQTISLGYSQRIV